MTVVRVLSINLNSCKSYYELLTYINYRRLSSAIKNTKHSTSEKNIIQNERRHILPNKHALWAKLSVVQQASVSSMYNYGYELSFIRTEGEEKYVVMLLNEAAIVIDEEGAIETQPSIQIRH